MAQDRSALDQQLIRFGPNAFVVVNQKKPSDITHRAHFCIIPLQEWARVQKQEGHLLQLQPTSSVLLGWLVSTSLALLSISSRTLIPRKTPPLALRCAFAHHQLRRAELPGMYAGYGSLVQLGVQTDDWLRASWRANPVFRKVCLKL